MYNQVSVYSVELPIELQLSPYVFITKKNLMLFFLYLDMHFVLTLLFHSSLCVFIYYSMNSSDLTELCTSNASVAAQHGRMDLVQAWSAALLIADLRMKPPLSADDGVPWPEHPFGRKLIHSL